MRKTILIAAVLAAMFAPLVSAQSAEGYYGGSYARMSFIKGSVYVQHGQDAGYEQGELNLVVLEGDKIGTKDGRVEVQLGRRNYLRLGENTQVDIVTLPKRDGDVTKIHLLAGSAFVRIDSLDGEKTFEIHSPDVSFYVMERGLYRVEVRENQETEFAVFSGSAEAAGEEGSVVVGSREQISAANGRLLSAPESLVSRRDELGDWNASRDAVFARKLDRTYLPADYYDYEVELADNGRWVNEAEYGNVWVPNSYYSDWRPYYNGRWSWYPIIGWTWVSYEPWGWCTSHYGRWGWGSGLGWYWIPQRHWGWGPAWVHWYGGHDYIGWCPLSYYNYPAVVLNNRFYGRYSSGYYPNGSRALTVVHRDQLQHRRLSGVALDRTRVGQLGNLSLGSAQPNRRPVLNADGDVASRARQALSREGVRSVGRSFSSTGKRLSSPNLRSNSSSGRTVESGATLSRKTGGGVSSGRVDSSRVGSGRSIRPSSGVEASPSRVRSFPSRSVAGNNSSGSSGSDRSRTSPARSVNSAPVRSGSSGSVGSAQSRETVSRDTARSYPSRKIGGGPGSPSVSSNPSSSRSVGSGTISPRSSSSGRSIQREYGSGLSGSSSPSRTVTTPSRSAGSSSPSYRAPTRRTEAPSRSSSVPSRSSSSPSYSAPSRSSSAPSRSYSPPSRSSSAPSRSYSPPSRSSSSPSYSAPSRSSSAPSRSYSAPSRSSSAPSRSSSGSSVSRGSGSSSSGGSVRRK